LGLKSGVFFQEPQAEPEVDDQELQQAAQERAEAERKEHVHRFCNALLDGFFQNMPDTLDDGQQAIPQAVSP